MIIPWLSNAFSRMRSKGSRFTLGVWGLRVCSLDVAFASATVRNRSREGPYGRAYGKFLQRWSFLEVSDVWLLRFAWQVWHFVTFRRVLQRVASRFCVAGAILLRRFQKMCCSFRGRRSTLDASIVIFRGRRSTLDASCGVFFVNRIGRAASSGDKVQIPWQAWHFLTCAENWRKPHTKHRFWGCKFSGSKEKLVGKRRFWSCKVWKVEEVSHEMLVLVLPPVSSRVSGFPVASPCLWGKLQNLSFYLVGNCENCRKFRTKC